MLYVGLSSNQCTEQFIEKKKDFLNKIPQQICVTKPRGKKNKQSETIMSFYIKISNRINAAQKFL